MELFMIFDEFAIKSLITPINDFPKAGVVFRDITPVFQSPKAFRMVVDSFVQRYIDSNFTHIGAIEARGFVLASAVAYALNKPLILFRKQGKLPAKVLTEAYDTEYEQSVLEVEAGCLNAEHKVLLMDDIIASGGTFLAAARLIRQMGANIYEVAAIVDLPELNGSRLLQDARIPTFTLTAFA